MVKFHTNAQGVISPCEASVRACRFGGSDAHFDSAESAARAVALSHSIGRDNPASPAERNVDRQIHLETMSPTLRRYISLPAGSAMKGDADLFDAWRAAREMIQAEHATYGRSVRSPHSKEDVELAAAALSRMAAFDFEVDDRWMSSVHRSILVATMPKHLSQIESEVETSNALREILSD